MIFKAPSNPVQSMIPGFCDVMCCGRRTGAFLDFCLPGSPEIRLVGISHTFCLKDLKILRYHDDFFSTSWKNNSVVLQKV